MFAMDSYSPFGHGHPPSAPTASPSHPPQPTPAPAPSRPPIKVKIVSWNMGDSLPKGDLCELFGKFDPYVPGVYPNGAFPDFGEGGIDSVGQGADDPDQRDPQRRDGSSNPSHPYHIIIVASQETPTQSGVPRGLGGGITKGLAGQKEKEKLKERGKERGMREVEKLVGSGSGGGSLGIGLGMGPGTPGLKPGSLGSSSVLGMTSAKDPSDLETSAFSPTQIPTPQFPFPSPRSGSSSNQATEGSGPSSLGTTGTGVIGAGMGVLPPTTPHHGHHTGHVNVNVGGGKGWSEILEDYLCHGIQQQSQTQAGPSGSSSAPAEKSNGHGRSSSRSRSISIRRDGRNRDKDKLFAKSQASTVFSEGSDGPVSPSIPNIELVRPDPVRVPPQGANTPHARFTYGLVPPPTFSRTSSAPPHQPGLVVPGTDSDNDAVDELDGGGCLRGMKSIVTPASPDLIGSPMSERTGTMMLPPIDRRSNASPLSIGSMLSDSNSNTSATHGLAEPNVMMDSGLISSRSGPAATLPEEKDKNGDKEKKRLSSLLTTPLSKRRDSMKRLSPIAIPAVPSVQAMQMSGGMMSASTPGTTLNGNNAATEVGNNVRRGAGPYQFLVKERLLGLYLAVFVHKDCASWVEGYDHDFVPTGLMGGRMGNKGAIGISLKMAGHRFLFVCAHLAAHASQMQARIANVGKIKTELGKNLDCFLSNEELQLKLPHGVADVADLDVTEKFDTTFWFGDLNFRLEVSRLHADWLVKHKEYEKALEFDQLRNAMREGKVFDGFVEGDIDFAPTFKYDVWHSAKKMRRRGELQSRERKEGMLGLPDVEEPENEEQEDDDDSPTDDQASFVSTTTTTVDRRTSIDSNLWLTGQIEEEDEESLDDRIQTVPQPVRPIAAIAKTGAIKVKHRFLKIMKSAGHSPASSSPSATPRTQSPTRSEDTAVGSQPNGGMSQQSSRRSIDSSRQSIDGEARPGLTRQISKTLKRRLSVRGPNVEDSASDSDEDTREGVYDTSSKQRVPSWCDRVLWKTHVEEDIGPQPRQFEVLSGQARFKLFGHAIAQKFHRNVRDPVERGGDNLHARFTRLLSDTGAPSLATTVTRQTSIAREPEPRTSDRGQIEGDIDTPRASVFSDVTIVPDDPQAAAAASSIGQQSTMALADGKERRSRRLSVSGLDSRLKDLSSQTTLDPAVGITLGQPIPSGPQLASVTALPEKPDSPRRHHSSGLDTLHPRRQERSTEGLPRSRTISGLPGSGLDSSHVDSSGEKSLASARRWISHLPGMLLHPLGGAVEIPPAVAVPAERSQDATSPVRRRKGQVNCLEYKTIDDAGMRKLEGRSDHRPIIFAAAIYT